jgi:anti-sigma B factor antagonist
MTTQNRTVTVRQIAAAPSRAQERAFLREMQVWMEADRPRVVLDCSQLRELDRASLRLMLCCLEEAMKRNGDVKLAALPPGAAAVMEEAGASRLFAVYATATDAANSFNRFPPPHGASPETSSASTETEPESAA